MHLHNQVKPRGVLMLQMQWKKYYPNLKLDSPKYPDVVQYDDGNEFKSKNSNKLLEDLDIKHFITLVKKGGKAFFNRKAALVERLNRTLKTIIWKYFTEHDTKKWLHIFDDVTFNYNGCYIWIVLIGL